jgi:hypothetical protein
MIMFAKLFDMVCIEKPRRRCEGWEYEDGKYEDGYWV